ncbi:MAG: response regulator [bacterium]
MQSPLKILLVDDDEVDRIAIHRALIGMNGSVIIDEAVNMSSGLENLKTNQYDCAIVDYLLPDGDGGLFVKEAASWEGCSTPILILTGRGNLDIDMKVMELGAADYLEKSDIVANILGKAIRYAIRNQLNLTKLENVNTKLQELDKLKSEFLSTASHELRTPLTIIKEYISLILDGITGKITPDQTECLKSALNNCDRLGHLINDILDLQRVESGKQQFHRSRTDITALIKESLNDFSIRCRTNNQKLELVLDDNLPMVLCDQPKTTQIIVNLIGNACKFTPSGGKITISVFIKGESTDFVTIEVRDTGVGISEEDQIRIFKSFTQVDRVDGPGPRGTGLGLTIVKNFVDLQDGDITLKSSLGQGSSFSFTLPLFSETKELVAFINDRYAVVNAEGRTLSIIFIKLVHRSITNNLHNQEIWVESMERLDKCFQDMLRRKNDEVLVQTQSGILVVAADTNIQGYTQLRKRIEETILREIDNDISLFIAGGMVVIENSVKEWIEKIEWHPVDPHELSQCHRILIVDNDSEIIDVITRILKSTDPSLQISSTNNGFEGCLRFGELKPDLLILDIKMSDFDGKQVLKSIKDSASRQRAKILIISGCEERFNEMMNLGADDCLAKPFNMNELVGKVQALLNGTNDEVLSENHLTMVNQ